MTEVGLNLRTMILVSNDINERVAVNSFWINLPKLLVNDNVAARVLWVCLAIEPVKLKVAFVLDEDEISLVWADVNDKVAVKLAALPRRTEAFAAAVNGDPGNPQCGVTGGLDAPFVGVLTSVSALCVDEGFQSGSGESSPQIG